MGYQPQALLSNTKPIDSRCRDSISPVCYARAPTLNKATIGVNHRSGPVTRYEAIEAELTAAEENDKW